MAFTGFVRAVRGERLLGDHKRITSDPCSTLREAEEWVSLMLASNVEAGKKVAEAGTTKQAGTRGKKGKTQEAEDDPRNNTDAENERAEAEAETAQPRRRARTAPGHRGANHAASARKNAK